MRCCSKFVALVLCSCFHCYHLLCSFYRKVMLLLITRVLIGFFFLASSSWSLIDLYLMVLSAIHSSQKLSSDSDMLFGSRQSKTEYFSWTYGGTEAVITDQSIWKGGRRETWKERSRAAGCVCVWFFCSSCSERWSNSADKRSIKLTWPLSSPSLQPPLCFSLFSVLVRQLSQCQPHQHSVCLCSSCRTVLSSSLKYMHAHTQIIWYSFQGS